MPVNIKLTNRVALEIALSTLPTNKSFTVDSATFSAEEVKTKLEAMLTAYEKKAAAPKKPTKTQQENEPIKQAIMEVLALNDALTISEMLTKSPALEGLTSQKVSALLTQLMKAGMVERVEKARKAYFKLA